MGRFRRSRRAALCVAVVAGCALAATVLAACSGADTELQVDEALRSRIASDYPGFVYVDSEGSSVPATDGNTEEDMQVRLERIGIPFIMNVQYGRTFSTGNAPGDWENMDTFWRAHEASVTDAFIDSFLERHEGQHVWVDNMERDASNADRFNVWYVTDYEWGPLSWSRGQGESFALDSATGKWSYP